MSIYGRSEGRRRLKNAANKGITNNQLFDMFETLWRDPSSMRTSGFNIAGGPDAVLSFDNPTRTFSIKPLDKKFSFYQFLHKLAFFKKRNEETVQIENVEGLHMIYYYFDEEDLSKPQKLYAVDNPNPEQIEDVYLNKVIIAWIYWDAQFNRAIYFGDERHGSEWSPQINYWAHRAFNGIRISGLRITDITIGDGSHNSHALFGVSPGQFVHEDINVVVNGLIPGHNIPLFYFSNYLPRSFTSLNFAVYRPSGLMAYNGSASSLFNLSEGAFTLVHVFAVNCFFFPVIAQMGLDQYAGPREAIEGLQNELDIILSLMAQQTRYHIGTLIFEASNSFANDVKARIYGLITPEMIADEISKDNTPFLKTGWHPEVLDQIYWSKNESLRRLYLNPVKAAPYFIQGEKFILDSVTTIDIADFTGLRYVSRTPFYWNFNESPFTGYENHFAFVTAIYWNSRIQKIVYAGWRMHMWEMESKTRGNIIKKTGLELVSGLEISINEEEGHEHEINVTDGVIRLADIVATITHGSGFRTFEMLLRSLNARRYYLQTYVDDTDPESPVTSHEWSFQDTPANYVANLAPNNEVVINVLDAEMWQLQETQDGDYTAMWLIFTLDYKFPLKWITGTAVSADLDEAKELNNSESLNNILQAAPFFDYKGVLSRVIIKNILDEPFYQLIEKYNYEDGEFEKGLTDRHVVDMAFDEVTRELTLFRNAGLLPLKATIPGGSGGGDPEPGADGREIELSVEAGYIVWHYVGDATWINLISVEAITGPPGEGDPGDDGREIELSTSGGNVVWRYVGETEWTILFAIPEPGDDGKQVELRENAGWVEWRYAGDATWTQLYEIPTSGGSGGDTFVVHIKFEAEGTEVYTCPYACKFTAIKYSQSTAPTLSVALNTNMSEYDSLDITAESGLVTLTGVWL